MVTLINVIKDYAGSESKSDLSFYESLGMQSKRLKFQRGESGLGGVHNPSPAQQLVEHHRNGTPFKIVTN